jgi:hypothetical protein
MRSIHLRDERGLRGPVTAPHSTSASRDVRSSDPQP